MVPAPPRSGTEGSIRGRPPGVSAPGLGSAGRPLGPVSLPGFSSQTPGPAPEMSYMLPHLHNGWQVDQAILSEEDRVVVIRFGHDWDPTCMKMDEVLYSIAEKERRNCLTFRDIWPTQSVERETLGLGVVSLSPTSGWWHKHQVMTSSCCPQHKKWQIVGDLPHLVTSPVWIPQLF
ncbi:thioredoxin-like protein 4A isoform X3 [Ursus arctos]|uniref:Thioredoxin like 4A n=1 Tax=Ursus maritimus TaxID=29073 RepID=A0A452TDT6_URSMA|nr:thioredoxin-like protein 4A isoform X3 [Ursus arctos]